MAEAIFKVLIQNLTSLIGEEVGLIIGVDKEMRKLSNTLTTIQTVLEDAEDKQFYNKTIQNWLRELNDIAYDVEDILDDCNTQILRLKRNGGNFNLKKWLFKYRIAKRIKEAVEKLDAVAENRKFHLDETVLRQSKPVDWRRETGFVLNEPDYIYGRDGDREKIVDVLVNQVKDREQLSVLPIVGIGGMGKTTLAQFVYNDESVSQHFDTKLWVCVSDDFDLKAILRAIIRDKSNLEDLNSLQLRLRQELSGKRYLLILDDVWNDDQEDWFKLKSILACGSMGASIVVTTRLKKVGDIMGTLSAHCLSQLSNKHCWLLFKLRAFGQESEQCPANLESIGRRIVKKCCGVPLAAKALGGLLRFNKEEKEWFRVEESPMWNLSEAEKSIFPVLRLSYRNLPFILKRCFIYCALFPKDYEFEKTELMFHWMAHGCISSDGKRQVEEVGDEVWKELSLRSFFQEIDTSGREIRFKMHDLVHDLAQSIMENRVPGADTASNSKIRQGRWSTRPESSSCSSIAVQVSTLTTIINYNRLRSLKLRELKMEELPSAIGKLKQLRYLDLSRSSIRSLPRTFCRLYNLQILLLVGCYHLKSLPKNIIYMSSLRHIDLEGCCDLSDMPYRIGELASLKTLNLFIVGDKKGFQLDELEQLNNLGGKLEIKHLERVKDHRDAKKANLKGKPSLRHLELRCEYVKESSESTKMMDGEKVLEALEPAHFNLTTLVICGFKSPKLASWMKEMINLTRISIVRCPNCTRLPPLGYLPLLKSLHINSLYALEYIVDVKDEIRCPNSSIFPSLNKLELRGLHNLKGLLNEEGAGAVGEVFPNLQQLDIQWCRKLTQLGLLAHLPLLKSLEFWDGDALKYIDSERDGIGCPNSPIFPSLEKLELDNLPNLEGLLKEEGAGVVFSNLRRVRISRCGKCTQLGLLAHLPLLKSLELKDLDALQYIDVEKDKIGSCPNSSIFPSLEELTLRRLPNLKGLLKEEGTIAVGEMFPNLHTLRIWSCPSLILSSSTSVSSALRDLKELRCSPRNLSLFNFKFRNLSCLSVDFGERDETNNIPLEGLSNLKEPTVKSASMGSCLREGWSRHLSALEELTIDNCTEFEAVMAEEVKHLHLLQSLRIENVRDMVSLPQALQHLPSLQYLTLVGLNNLTSLPEWLPHLKSLTNLEIMSCPQIPSLPSCMTYLKSLFIAECPKLERQCEEPNGEDWPKIARIPHLQVQRKGNATSAKTK